MADVLRRLAPAKINLILEVGSRRPDGYHEVDTVMQELTLADDVSISFDGPAGVVVTGPYADGSPADETNLAWRAAAELAARCGKSTDGLRITLDKHIPPAGGLGGGASDAVATLRLLQQPWHATEAQLFEAANAIGSDEAFFLVGDTARARGRGEVVEALPPLRPHGIVLFIPPDTLERKTARLFAALDALPVEPVHASEDFSRHQQPTLTSGDVVNSFERVARDLFPGLAELWADIETHCGEPVHLAGAGPTLFWIGTQEETEAIAAACQGLPCTVVPTSTASPADVSQPPESTP